MGRYDAWYDVNPLSWSTWETAQLPNLLQAPRWDSGHLWQQRQLLNAILRYSLSVADAETVLTARGSTGTVTVTGSGTVRQITVQGLDYCCATCTPLIESVIGQQGGAEADTLGSVIVSGATTNRALLCFFANPPAIGDGAPTGCYYDNQIGGGSHEDFTHLGTAISLTNPTVPDEEPESIRLDVWYLLGPSASAGGGGTVQIVATGSHRRAMSVYVLSGVSTVTEAASTVSDGTTTISSSGGSGLVVDAIAYSHLWSDSTDATAGAGQTEDYSEVGGGSFGVVDMALQGSHRNGAGAMAWSSIPVTSSNSPHWLFCGTVQKVVSVTCDPARTTPWANNASIQLTAA
jgi:hypothetical protein